MITEGSVLVRLDQWARHVAGGLSGQFLGFPGRCTYLELAIKSTNGGGRDVPEQVWETDRAIRSLDQIHPGLRTAIEMTYLGTGTMVERATELGITDRTLERRLDRAVQHLITILDSYRK